MKQEEETKVLICLPVEGPPGRYIVPGSVEANCCDCGVRVYVAPSGRKLQESGKCIIVCTICTKCGLRRLEQEKEPKFEVVPGQDKEIRDRLCRD